MRSGQVAIGRRTPCARRGVVLRVVRERLTPNEGLAVVKVFKSVGAVRVYNPWNAIWAILGITLLVAGIGFGIGWLANNGDNGSTSSVAPSDTAGRQAAYQSGLAAGRRQGAAAASTKASKSTAAVPKAAPKTVVTGNAAKGFKSGNAYTRGSIKSSGSYFAQVRP